MTSITVVAAVVERDGRYLLTRRLPDTHLAGLWEFPGGKVHDGESHDAALRREMREELGVDAGVGPKVFEVAHDYGDRRVHLYFYACTLVGLPQAQLGQEMAWVAREELRGLEFPEADRGLIDALSGA